MTICSFLYKLHLFIQFVFFIQHCLVIYFDGCRARVSKHICDLLYLHFALHSTFTLLGILPRVVVKAVTTLKIVRFITSSSCFGFTVRSQNPAHVQDANHIARVSLDSINFHNKKNSSLFLSHCVAIDQENCDRLIAVCYKLATNFEH